MLVKMIKKKVLILILLFLLAGCSIREEMITVCEIDHLDIMGAAVDGNVTSTLKSIEDQLIMIEEINRLELESLSAVSGITTERFLELWERNPTAVEEAFLGSIEMTESGMTATLYDITDTYFIIRIVIDFAEMSLEDLENLTGESVSFVSLTEAIENIEAEGGVCR